MKVNLKKLFIATIIGAGVFVSQPAKAFYYDTSDNVNYTNNLINSTRNYILGSEVIGHTGKGNYTMAYLPPLIFKLLKTDTSNTDRKNGTRILKQSR